MCKTTNVIRLVNRIENLLFTFLLFFFRMRWNCQLDNTKQEQRITYNAPDSDSLDYFELFTAERMRGSDVDSSLSASDQKHGEINELSEYLVCVSTLLFNIKFIFFIRCDVNKSY